MDLGWLSHAVSIPESNADAIASPAMGRRRFIVHPPIVVGSGNDLHRLGMSPIVADDRRFTPLAHQHAVPSPQRFVGQGSIEFVMERHHHLGHAGLDG